MRCPKCGYNSFDYLDSCKKCNQDLTEHKARFHIKSVMLPGMPGLEAIVGEETAPLTAAATAESADTEFDDFGLDSPEETADDFGFDFMGDSDEEEELAFDELFEEVPSEEDLEETLPAPEEATAEPAPITPDLTPEADSTDEFSFDNEDLETDSVTEDIFQEDSDFGFESDEDPAADIFAETEEDFSVESFDSDAPTKK